MKTLLVLLLSLLSNVVTRGDELLLRHSTAFEGREYFANLMESDLAGIRLWTDSDNPPLSPKRAEGIATDYARMLFGPGTWTTASIGLTNLGRHRWIYIIELHPPMRG